MTEANYWRIGEEEISAMMLRDENKEIEM